MMLFSELPCLDATPSDHFPPTSDALEFPKGLLAWGGNLSTERLLAAYRRGIFPWYSQGEPILWWSPVPRCVILPEKIYISSRTRRRLRQGAFRLTADTAFRKVVRACAKSRPDRPSTWITREMKQAYGRLHEMGYCHSVETWNGERLVGGVYGLAIGNMFFGESMFSLETDASKVALITLCRQFEDWGIGMIDCQVTNPHLERMGAEELGRDEFEAHLSALTSASRPPGPWISEFRTDWVW